MITMVTESRINSPEVEVSGGEDSAELFIHLPVSNQEQSLLNKGGNNVVNNAEHCSIVSLIACCNCLIH